MPEEIQALVQAAITATQTSNVQQQQTLGRPDIPPFDKKNIEQWIRCMEAAFRRCNITSADHKFAHMDRIFHADGDPVINNFLAGDQTDAKWAEFVAHLREQHGRTKRMQAHSVINGTPRDGRRPSQLRSVMLEKAGKISIEEVLKEHLMKELPNDIAKMIQAEVEGLNFEETCKVADKHFDKEGNVLHNSHASGINSIQPKPALRTSPTSSQQPSTSHSSFTAAFPPEDDGDINAVRANYSAARKTNNNNGYNSSRPFNNSRGCASGSGGIDRRDESAKVCKYHIQYGKDAKMCQSTCMMWSTHPMSKGQASR